jgi:hypothetical protein
MHLWRAALVILMAAAALPPCEAAGAESPLPPAATPSVVTPPASTAPAAPPAKGPPVILSSLPPMSGVFGGKVEFAEKAFPIVAEAKDVAVQGAIRGAKPLPCRTCNGTGKISKRELVKPGPTVRGNPIWQSWEEDCLVCGGFKDIYDPRIGQRLLVVIDRLSHVPRDEKFDELRKAVEGCLVVAMDVRKSTITTLRCKPTIRTDITSDVDSQGFQKTHTVRTLVDVTTEPYQQNTFHVDVSLMVEPLWTRVGSQPPTGQAVIIIGTTSEKTEAGGWVWMRMQPAKGTAAIILCGTPQKNVVPEGRIVLGGLMVGRWTPEGGAAPASPASATPVTGPPAASLPVILAVVATEGVK